jgi:DNA polymerase-4
MDEDVLMKRYGTMGRRLYSLARGQDDRKVHLNDEAKTVSAETTFFEDYSRAEDLVPVLRALSEQVSRRLKKAALAGHTVVLKLKTQDFKTRTRNRRLEAHTQLADRIFREGLSLLDKELDGTKYRLLGIGVSDLGDSATADPPDLIDHDAGRRAKAEAAMDALRDKFGNRTIEMGYTFGRGKRGHG